MAEHTRLVIRKLRDLIEDVGPGLIVKILITSPARSLQVMKEVMENEHVILPRGMRPGRNNGRQSSFMQDLRKEIEVHGDENSTLEATSEVLEDSVEQGTSARFVT